MLVHYIFIFIQDNYENGNRELTRPYKHYVFNISYFIFIFPILLAACVFLYSQIFLQMFFYKRENPEFNYYNIMIDFIPSTILISKYYC